MNTANLSTNHHIYKPAAARMEIAHNALINATASKPTFFIERAFPHFGNLMITYINEADLNAGNTTEEYWKDASISFIKLEEFACESFGITGNYGDVNVAIYLDENLIEAAKAYLEAGKEIMPL